MKFGLNYSGQMRLGWWIKENDVCMVFILFEDGSDVNFVKMMAGSMIMRDFTENLKKHWNVSKWAQEICKLNIFIN
jgi:hypothetical protein